MSLRMMNTSWSGHSYHEVEWIQWAFGDLFYVSMPTHSAQPQLVHIDLLNEADPDWRALLRLPIIWGQPCPA